MRYLLFFAAIYTSIFSVIAQADTVWLKNGDRLTGRIVLLDAGKLLLNTDYAGTITLNIKKVATLKSEQPLLVKLDTFTTEKSKALRPAPEGRVTLVNGDKPKTLALADIKQLMVPRPLIEDLRWKGNVSLSADYKRKENKSNDYSLDLSSELRHGSWRHALDSDYDYETKNGAKHSESFKTDYALDHFITERWFWKNKAKYTNDHSEDVRRQYLYGTGPGFQFWDNELGALALSGLLNHNKIQFSSGPSKRFSSGTFSWNYNRFLAGKTFEIYSKGEIGAPFMNDIDYIIDSEAGLRFKVSSWAALTLKAELEKMSSIHGNLNDRRYTIGIGVGW